MKSMGDMKSAKKLTVLKILENCLLFDHSMSMKFNKNIIEIINFQQDIP